MTLPSLLASTVLGDDTAVTLGMVGTIVLVAVIIGELRWQVAHLREWRRTAEAEHEALSARVGALEIRESRTLERIDHLTTQLVRIEEKLDRLLDRREHA